MAIIEILKKHCSDYGIEIDNLLAEKLNTYGELLREWNDKINLTAILDDEGIAVKHFLDCLIVGKYADFKKMVATKYIANDNKYSNNDNYESTFYKIIEKIRNQENLLGRLVEHRGLKGRIYTRVLTHQVSITGLHPLDRHDEGMIGQMTR